MQDMLWLEGMVHKYVVIKNEDIDEFLDLAEREKLLAILHRMEQRRYTSGKALNSYVVVNTDEPYIDEIVSIMERNGHWG